MDVASCPGLRGRRSAPGLAAVVVAELTHHVMMGVFEVDGDDDEGDGDNGDDEAFYTEALDDGDGGDTEQVPAEVDDEGP